MKYIKKFDSVADMTAALASSTISVLGMAMNGNTPVVNIKEVTPTPPGPDYSIPFYVENITNSSETLLIRSYDWGESGEDFLEITVEYSTDGSSWSTLGTTGETALEMTLEPDDKVYLRASTNFWYEYSDEPYVNHVCTINGVSKVGGNIMSLLYGSNFTGNERTFPSGTIWNFVGLFKDESGEGVNTVLVNASELLLPATTLAEGCYVDMFTGCTSLTSAPALPATTLVQDCYSSMFYGCESLTATPALPATTLTYGCYVDMFSGCISLTTSPALPATTLAESCYTNMFYGCTSLTSAPALPATTLAQGCYENMFDGCTSLTTAPTLPATTLAEGCYGGMFTGCTSLTSAPALPATTLVQYCYSAMFQSCTSLTTAPALPATTLAQGCYDTMFQGCTSLTTTPVLPATTLADYCYNYMFGDCTSLNEVTTYANDISAENCLQAWLYNVAETGTFNNMGSASYPSGASGNPWDTSPQL